VLYLGIQLVRQIPLSPGGIGLIETSLVAGLVLLGADNAAAAAATLGYRLLSCWLVIPAGLVAWLLLTRRQEDPSADERHHGSGTGNPPSVTR
jgi:uncharacterized protein (TIRG00374 family)